MDLHTYHLHTQTALHCGTGQSAGIVDLPIARDKATNLPLVPGSSIRGVLRDDIRAKKQDIEEALFGPRSISNNSQSFAGALSIGDANLLILPVRSLHGIVAYTTCPFILRRYAKDAHIPKSIPQPESLQALTDKDNINRITAEGKDLIILEDLDIPTTNNEHVEEWATAIAHSLYANDSDLEKEFIKRFVVLSDDVFNYLSTTATEIRTRIRINEATGVVDKGALWSEENLPANSVLWGVYSVDTPKNKHNITAESLQKTFASSYLLQMGGNSGIGRGLVHLLTDDERGTTA
ncbi:type III-B CRISPR module RAMP protein Cmr4 [Marinomonas mediterranea]|uniref:type III-B CRISPR module RAMP protein Cmr4 n=1 Tax=Marinomonas mediterranea TaxID=119864 RepID=UPI00234B374D|nr:type III-B CRISPR module RAMP protein Cmr4 [Marinomonas mediterranea]WCN08278.1 type III-B CRISPR module RAMP protein Cmr4 [Marinomonas mediterranea]